MEITMDDDAQYMFNTSESLNMQSGFFAGNGPGDDDDEPEEKDESDQDDPQGEPELDPDIVHSQVVSDNGGRPK